MNVEKYHMRLVNELKIVNWFFQCQFIQKLIQTKTYTNTSLPALPDTITAWEEILRAGGERQERVLPSH